MLDEYPQHLPSRRVSGGWISCKWLYIANNVPVLGWLACWLVTFSKPSGVVSWLVCLLPPKKKSHRFFFAVFFFIAVRKGVFFLFGGPGHSSYWRTVRSGSAARSVLGWVVSIQNPPTITGSVLNGAIFWGWKK